MSLNIKQLSGLQGPIPVTFIRLLCQISQISHLICHVYSSDACLYTGSSLLRVQGDVCNLATYNVILAQRRSIHTLAYMQQQVWGRCRTVCRTPTHVRIHTHEGRSSCWSMPPPWDISRTPPFSVCLLTERRACCKGRT